MAIHSVSTDVDLPYFIMPYLRGASLQQRLDEDGPLPVSEVLRIGSQIAAGLAAAHAQGIIHRDIKPANIMLEEGVERVAITDFGLARAVDDATMTRSGVIAGTPQYMSPEQARGETCDPMSDLFSLGSVLYAMCTGRVPFRAETSFGVMRRITDEEPRSIREINPEIPEWLCRIIEKMMSKEPGQRFDSAHEIAVLMEECLAHTQQPGSVPLPKSAVMRKPTQRARIVPAWFLGTGLIVIVLFVLFALRPWQEGVTPLTNIGPQTQQNNTGGADDQPNSRNGLQSVEENSSEALKSLSYVNPETEVVVWNIVVIST